MYTRLYYLLSAEEAREMVEDLNVVQARGSVVCGLIYDSLLLEHDGPLPIDGMSLLEKPLPRWQDNLFMVLRTASDRTTEAVRKPDLGKRMCILTALLNVGSSKIQKASAVFTSSGPHSYLRIQQYLVAKRTGQYLQKSTLRDLASAPPGHAFLVHAHSHCVGVCVCEDNAVHIADDSSPNLVRLDQTNFCDVKGFAESHSDAATCVFRLQSGNFSRDVYDQNLNLRPVDKRRRPVPPCSTGPMVVCVTTRWSSLRLSSDAYAGAC